MQIDTVVNQVPVVQRADNSIQWINRYTADKTNTVYPKDSDLSAG